MFITSKYSGYNRHDEQTAGGLFLILMDRKSDWDAYFAPGNRDPQNPRRSPTEVRAVVRYARFTQFGHFMMGSTRIGPDRYTLSGAYGHDGLILSVSDASFERGIPLPAELYEAWARGGGHNSAGSEAEAMREWALANLDALRGHRPIKKGETASC